MDLSTFKPDHIEDYLVTVRTGQWFGWSDSSNKIFFLKRKGLGQMFTVKKIRK